MARRPRPTDRAAALTAATAALSLGAAAATLLPERFGLGHRFPFVATVAFRPQAALAAAAAGLLLTPWRPARPVAAALGTAAVAGLTATAAARRPERSHPHPDPATLAGPPAELVILTANVLHGQADCGALSTLIERSRPDFVVLPEAGSDFRDKLMPALEVLGYRSWVSTEPDAGDSRSVTLLAGPRAGDVRVRAASAMHLAHLEATGGLLGARTLYAVHTAAPIGRRLTARWSHDLEVLGHWCAAPVAPIVAGDLNATLDHGPLRAALGGCRGAAGAGRGLVGTFPTRLPRSLGIQIDHIVVPVDASTSRFEVVELPGSDHRGVLATVRLHTGPVPLHQAERPGSSITI
jgi:endonuclease/exonuclease/phosphatase (EEP) superfamily protein YafD